MRFSGPFISVAQTVMSAPFCAALAWTSGTASFDGLRRFNDAAVNALVPRIRIITDSGRKLYEPHIAVQFTDGRKLEWTEQAGDTNYRVTWAAATRMSHQLCEEVGVPRPLAQTLIDAVAQIELSPTVRPLMAAVCAATTHV